jgi:hypothetical protein
MVVNFALGRGHDGERSRQTLFPRANEEKTGPPLRLLAQNVFSVPA